MKVINMHGKCGMTVEQLKKAIKDIQAFIDEYEACPVAKGPKIRIYETLKNLQEELDRRKGE